MRLTGAEKRRCQSGDSIGQLFVSQLRPLPLGVTPQEGGRVVVDPLAYGLDPDTVAERRQLPTDVLLRGWRLGLNAIALRLQAFRCGSWIDRCRAAAWRRAGCSDGKGFTMRFPMPNLPCEFEIPDEWLSEAGFVGFTPQAEAYRSTPDAVLVSLVRIEPVARFATHPKDFNGFERVRLVRLLKGFVAGDQIEAAEAIELPIREVCAGSYRYRVCDGFHRYRASIAAGFAALPVRL